MLSIILHCKMYAVATEREREQRSGAVSKYHPGWIVNEISTH